VSVLSSGALEERISLFVDGKYGCWRCCFRRLSFVFLNADGGEI
jgi:hypothetical protein